MISYTLPDMNELMEKYGLAEDWYEAYSANSFYAEVTTSGKTLSCATNAAC